MGTAVGSGPQATATSVVMVHIVTRTGSSTNVAVSIDFVAYTALMCAV